MTAKEDFKEWLDDAYPDPIDKRMRQGMWKAQQEMINSLNSEIASLEEEGKYSFEALKEERLNNKRLIVANLRLEAALLKIANLDPETDSIKGFNEWGEADCFNQAKDIAREALTFVAKA